ncbi:mediator-associated protein 1-like [Trifolium pratense]|uniref:Mediator-associated protein 1-like n=1 Tax=Trifolium pratense TaxID=57577 RepID=A0A2K3LT84_TRIPR|nr:mediator-associated protein 1-like [Trifolium pratense]
MASKNHYVQLPSESQKPVADSEPNPQPQSRSSAQAQTSLTSGKKRDVEDKNANGNTSKRLKKKKETVFAAAGGGSGEEKNDCMEEKKSKKKSGRVFSEEDDLVILRGLADFISKTRKDPLKNAAEFHYFMREEKSFRSDLRNSQIKRKIRTLKDKFEKRRIFTVPHDKKAFKLFNKIIWTNNDENEAEEENQNEVESSVGYILNEIFRCDVDMALDWNDAKKGLESTEESSRAEMDEKWRKLHIEEMNLVVTQTQYAKDRVRLGL